MTASDDRLTLLITITVIVATLVALAVRGTFLGL